MMASNACAGELLYNGICLPRAWPPRFSGAGGLPPREPAPPPWVSSPPSVINISLGRQLFVDPFLIASMSGLQLLNHAAKWEQQVLRATEPWEATRQVPKASWPQGSRAIGYANPVSGGVWWDERHEPKPCFRVWYACGSQSDQTTKAGTYGCCYAESDDGLRWRKPRVGTGAASGTNIVLQEPFDGNVVWLDHDAPADRRWVMATVPRWFGFAQFHFLTSPDGIAWQSRRNGSGAIGDRSTFFYNPFRRKWVYSIKYLFPTPEWGFWGRARAYREGKDLIADASWSATAGEPNGPYPWTAADAADPPWPYNSSLAAELYNLDGVAYESVMVGLYEVFRGFVDANATARARRTSGEHDEIYLGFSRDGFHWWRQFDGDAQVGGARPRRPFLSQSWPAHSWHNNGLGTVGAGLVLRDDRLWFYAKGTSGLPFDPSWSGGNASMGVASLRRDGFTSVEAVLPGEPGLLTTRPVVWDADRQHLFLNLVIQPGGFVQVAVRDVHDERTLAGFELDNSTVGPVGRAECLPDDAVAFDSTRAPVGWAGASLASVAGRPVRLQFRLVAASLYSFWVARSACGASDGFIGGPGTQAGRDVHGGCAP